MLILLPAIIHAQGSASLSRINNFTGRINHIGVCSATTWSSSSLNYSLTTLGQNPSLDGNTAWATSCYRMGGSLINTADVGNSSTDEFVLTLQSLQNADSASLGSFKGPLFADTGTNVTSSNSIIHSSNAITSYSHILSGNTSGYAEGLVHVTDDQGTGDGVEIGIESDVGPGNSNGPALQNCESSPLTNKCKINYYGACANGTGNDNKTCSWFIYSGNTGNGWNGGIRLNNLASNALALAIPNATKVSARDNAGTDRSLAQTLSSGVEIFGDDSATNAAKLDGVATSPSGTPIVNFHIVQGTGRFSSGAATVTLSNGGTFTSSTSYACFGNDTTTGTNAVRAHPNSGTGVSFSGTGSDNFIFTCMGN